jgi:hypothetical protein
VNWGLRKDELFIKNTIRWIFKGREIDGEKLQEYVGATFLRWWRKSSLTA